MNCDPPDAELLYEQLLGQLKSSLAARHFELAGLALGGAWLAQRLAQDLNHPTFGVINAAFHRDDYADKRVAAFHAASAMPTHIRFEVTGHM